VTGVTSLSLPQYGKLEIQVRGRAPAGSPGLPCQCSDSECHCLGQWQPHHATVTRTYHHEYGRTRALACQWAHWHGPGDSEVLAVTVIDAADPVTVPGLSSRSLTSR
jgi:hypothetical protein